MEKKNIAIGILAVLLIASGVGNIILGVQLGFIEVTPPESRILNLVSLTGGAPHTNDPIECWDQSSGVMIDQVAQALFDYDFSVPYDQITLIPNLATGYTPNNDASEFNITLRQGVTFHDGVKFNATTVKWNFDRMAYWGNYSGRLGLDKWNETSMAYDIPPPEGYDAVEAYAAYLYHFSDGVTPMWNQCNIVDEYTVQFVLNGPFSPFPELISYTAFAQVSPESTPFYDILDLSTDKVIGTGPYEEVLFFAGEELRFEVFDDYWGPEPYFEEVVITYYDDTLAAQQALIAGQFDYGGVLAELIDDFKASPHIDYINYTGITGFTGTTTWMEGINNGNWNATYRKAMAFAYNYTYWLEGIMGGQEVRAYGALPPGFPYALEEDEVDYPYTNLTIARNLMIQADPGNFSGFDINSDTEWEAFAATEAYTLYYYGVPGSYIYDVISEVVGNALAKIGIYVEQKEATWSDFLATMKVDPTQWDMWLTGWGPDYLNPLNMIAPIIYPTSPMAHTQVNDATLLAMLDDVAQETNESALEAKFVAIQKRIVEDVVPFITLSWSKLDYAAKPGLVTTFNPMGRARYSLWYYE
jgi:peptide/nickel transport system substrate-binding protein